MSFQEDALIESRKADFGQFYQELLPALVEFIDGIGIKPAHTVLTQADQYLPYLELALREMTVAEDDRSWLLTRMMYFIGEYFAQKHGGCWYVNDIAGSRFSGRYVVGKFAGFSDKNLMVDPAEVAQAYVDTAVPRQLSPLLSEVEAGLNAIASSA